MSSFFTKRYAALEPYTPGEQPQDMQYIKLNTNESPFPPSPGAAAAVAAECARLQLYSDPESRKLTEKLAEIYGVKPEQVLMTNGSDEILNFAFMAFADEERPLLFPDISYGFYPVFAQLNHIPYEEIPLKEDFSIDPADYCGGGKTVVIANPNAPTGMTLNLKQIEQIVAGNPDGVSSWTRPMWTSVGRVPCAWWIGMKTFWSQVPFPSPAPWRGPDWASISGMRR